MRSYFTETRLFPVDFQDQPVTKYVVLVLSKSTQMAFGCDFARMHHAGNTMKFCKRIEKQLVPVDSKIPATPFVDIEVVLSLPLHVEWYMIRRDLLDLVSNQSYYEKQMADNDAKREWVKKMQEEGKVQVITMEDLKGAFSTDESTPTIDWRGGNYL